MKFLFTKSKAPFSVLLRWGLQEPVSHFAIEFDNKIIFHSNFFGTQINWSRTFKRKCDVVYEIVYPLPLYEEEAMYQAVLDSYDGRPYDWKGFLYFLWRVVLFKLLGTPLPEKNAWQSDTSDLCIEILTHLPKGEWNSDQSWESLAITSPYQVYSKLKIVRDKHLKSSELPVLED